MDDRDRRLFYDNQNSEVIKGLSDKIMNVVVREGRMFLSDGHSHDVCILTCRILHLEKELDAMKDNYWGVKP